MLRVIGMALMVLVVVVVLSLGIAKGFSRGPCHPVEQCLPYPTEVNEKGSVK